MKIKHLLSVAALSLCVGAFAQSVPTHEMYVQYAIPNNIVEALDEWEPGRAWGVGNNYVDENFFISRVPIKNRFVPGAQANPDLNDTNAKNLGWCVPTGEMTKKWGPLPRYNFDGDNFSMWQYIKYHSNWSNSWWRVPGVFNDVAHKNGVATGCTYFIDWGRAVTAESPAGKVLYDLVEQDFDGNFIYARKLIQFLKYYGIDGLTFNPEGYWSTEVYEPMIDFLAECHKIAKELNHPFHVDWYAFVSNTGALSDNNCSLTVGNNDHWFHHPTMDQPVTDMFFLNYNWSEWGLEMSANAAKSLGRSSFDVYAGFDQQARGYGQNGNAGWNALMRQPVSIVVWGAHDRSQLYISSTEGGQSDYAVQNEYVKKQELLFSGGNRNVLDLPKIKDDNTSASFSDLATWHGYAKAVREQSTLYELPFVTRFNLGNGRFMNNEGVTTWNHKWYNIGMQDMLPTWRWWIDNGDGKSVPSQAIELDFTFDDAWFAGSCLKVHGATERSDVRLFATKWDVENGDDEFRLVYKPNVATSNLQLMVSKEGAENNFVYVALPQEAKAGEWNSVVIKASEAGLQAGDVIGCIGLSVRNTNANYEALLGEFAFVPASFNEKPATPVITHAEVLKRFYNRADIKIVWNMPEPASRKAEYKDCPVYNEEVGTWYYEIWVKQGEQETLVTTTTSWAAYAVDAPMIIGIDAVQIGVRAVGKDGRAKSDIVWSDEIVQKLTLIETLTVDKEIIKPNEEFTIGFEDPNHTVSDIEIYNAFSGKLEASGKDVLTLTISLPETGSYDVKVTTDGKELMNRSLILVSPEETGRLPQINSLVSDIQNISPDNREVNFTADINKGTEYLDAPCTVSQSLYMSEPYQLTVDADIMNVHYNTSFALWFKVEKFEHASLGTLLMTKVDRNHTKIVGDYHWTTNVWGEMWTAIRPAGYAKNNNIGRDNAENELSVCFDGAPAGTPNYEHNNDVDGLTEGYAVQPGVWYHVCITKNGRDLKMYLNGKEVINCQSRGRDPNYAWGNAAKFYVGGSMTNLASFTGWVDEVQIWSKTLSPEEVLQSMRGYKTAPDNLEGYFTFENTKTDENGYIYFPNSGKNVEAVAGAYMTIGKDDNGTNRDYPQNQLTTALGVPMLEGSLNVNYESSRWMLDGAVLNSSTDETANATYKLVENGKYSVTLTANNSWGSTSKTITDYIVVTDIDDVNAENGYMIYPNVFKGTADVLFAADGIYDVVVFSADGKRVASDIFEARAGELRTISLADASEGIYVVTVMKEGKVLRSFKIQK
ncbi:MAG: T9SS type A sorting domain-containing protein [Bacteroidaceae bacterium]|nr:T9SS type A sorting domain-containing protein [Bacteroidaceae bacterium]